MGGKPGARGNQEGENWHRLWNWGVLAMFTNTLHKQVAPKDTWQHGLKSSGRQTH